MCMVAVHQSLWHPELVAKKAEFLKDSVRVDVVAVRAAMNPMKAITVPDAKIDAASVYRVTGRTAGSGGAAAWAP